MGLSQKVHMCSAGLIWVKPSEQPGSKAANANGSTSSIVDTSDIPILPEIDVSPHEVHSWLLQHASLHSQ